MTGRGTQELRLPLIGLLIAALALAAVLAAPAAAAPPSGIAVKHSSPREVRRFWTPARMRQAKPLDYFVHRKGGLAARPAPVPPSESSFEQVADPAAEGYRQNGVIFFLVLGIFPGRCSGTAVRSANSSVVITAGHCVNIFGTWLDEDWAFVPGYRFGQRPFGIFPAKRLDATRQWLTSESENADVGAAVVGRNERGQLLGEAVGGAGIAWNKSPNQVFDVHGYPAEEPFDGETQRICRGTPFLGHDPQSFVATGPLNLAVDCQVTGGASGGGWTIAGNRLNSVTNYGYSDAPEMDFGAYFGTEVAKLYGRVGGGK